LKVMVGVGIFKRLGNPSGLLFCFLYQHIISYSYKHIS
jgi:hypothetical protein